jgi:hypothetical protein
MVPVEANVKELVVINMLVGGWLVFTSWAMPGGVGMSRLTLNEATAGAMLILLSAWTLASTARRPVALWLQLAVGAWLIAAPFVLRFNPWNDVLCGVMTLAIAISAMPYWTERAMV